MTRQQYTPEFKRRAVALLLDSGKSVARMAQELDIKENTLYNWKKLYRRCKHSMLGYQTLVDYEMAA
ncbi:transposase [Pectobacterium parmentieri]|uniref:transposase n=1 Tax=Pectobacterium parmentieri TaxID=1905730 RepID=UPI000EB21E42|nr:transposase [Pectobacterium parmentieri]AYH02017.1 hypothetical protein C5E26_14300 [Pectobacterium parmentieri]AYH28284.1 hypothetical protein C5E20_14705 [Pectobacterium parmentieri]AYH32590.1 hypothetical protein C5E19_13735 [Pectobacterium parmentieri]